MDPRKEAIGEDEASPASEPGPVGFVVGIHGPTGRLSAKNSGFGSMRGQIKRGAGGGDSWGFAKRLLQGWVASSSPLVFTGSAPLRMTVISGAWIVECLSLKSRTGPRGRLCGGNALRGSGATPILTGLAASCARRLPFALPSPI